MTLVFLVPPVLALAADGDRAVDGGGGLGADGGILFAATRVPWPIAAIGTRPAAGGESFVSGGRVWIPRPPPLGRAVAGSGKGGFGRLGRTREEGLSAAASL